MNKKYFNNCKCIEELKREYRLKAMYFHPDNLKTGNLEQMQNINNEYEFYFNLLKNIHENLKTGENETSTTNTNETAYDFMNIINQIINYENIDINIVGSWIWVSGDTKPIKDILKGLKFFWNKKRVLWQLKPVGEETTKRSYSKESSDNVKLKYGCTKINTHKPVLI